MQVICSAALAGSTEHFHLSHIGSAILHLENSTHSFSHYGIYSEDLQSYLLQRIFLQRQ